MTETLSPEVMRARELVCALLTAELNTPTSAPLTETTLLETIAFEILDELEADRALLLAFILMSASFAKWMVELPRQRPDLADASPAELVQATRALHDWTVGKCT